MARTGRVIITGAVLVCLVFPAASGGWYTDKANSDDPRARSFIELGENELSGDWTDEAIERAISYFEQALKLDPENPEILAKLSMLYFERGHNEREKNRDNIAMGREFFERGYEFGQEALAIEEGPSAHYFTAINLGAMAESSGTFSQVRSFVKIRSHINWISENSENYGYGATARFWCDCHQNAPSAVIAVIGQDKEEVCKAIDRSISEAPAYIENYVYKAKCCVDEESPEKRLEILEKALSIEPESMPREAGSNRFFRKMALSMWKDVSGKSYPTK